MLVSLEAKLPAEPVPPSIPLIEEAFQRGVVVGIERGQAMMAHHVQAAHHQGLQQGWHHGYQVGVHTGHRCNTENH